MQAGLPVNRHRSALGSSLTELPLALTILFLFVFVPMLDLFGLATGAATAYLLAHEAASRASQQRRYVDAVKSLQSTSAAFNQTGLSKFAKMVPVGGYGGCGVDLYIDASNYRSGILKRFGPNLPVPPPIDVFSWVYECTTQATFEIGPIIDLSFLPLLGSVPGLGKPAVLTYWASRAAEHASGLEQAAPQGNSGGTVPLLNQTPSETSLNGGNPSAWNFPTIYDQIAAAGETVVSVNVVVVNANNSNWTPTSITVTPGEKIWIDTSAAGQWSTCPALGYPFVNANGFSGPGIDPSMLDTNYFQGTLLGKIGSSSQPFLLGVDRFNYTPLGTPSGNLSLICNDLVNYYSDNIGSQVVRVIVVK